jgi:tRNA threonylcarbamoyl adenosine modification protein YeaZ
LKFLAIDTSGKHLTVLAYNEGSVTVTHAENCAMQHSVRLMEEIDGVFARAQIRPADCDFFAVVVGAGSFTGIRIGIATVKGLCFACGKPALAVTSFDTVAYAEKNEPILALVDAWHGFVYACGYDGEKRVTFSPQYISGEELQTLAKEYTFASAEALSFDCARSNVA